MTDNDITNSDLRHGPLLSVLYARKRAGEAGEDGRKQPHYHNREPEYYNTMP